MEIRTEDARAIVSAVEWLLEGGLDRVTVRRDGETVFAAHTEASELVVDPDAMSPDLARHLLEHTSLFDEDTSSSGDARSDEPNGGTRRPGEIEKRPARA